MNRLMTATDWEMGRRIVEHKQEGAQRARYGDEVLERLSADLTSRFGRGFSRVNLQSMRQFYQAFPLAGIRQTLSGISPEKEIRQTANTACSFPTRRNSPGSWQRRGRRLRSSRTEDAVNRTSSEVGGPRQESGRGRPPPLRSARLLLVCS